MSKKNAPADAGTEGTQPNPAELVEVRVLRDCTDRLRGEVAQITAEILNSAEADC